MQSKFFSAAIGDAVLLLLLSGLSAAGSLPQHPALGQLGIVAFSTSCEPAVQKEFERGIALLHSFSYAEARTSFMQVAARDPDCAMAYWGSAMTRFHQLWDPPFQADDAAKGRQEIQRAQQVRAPSDRERRFIAALAHVYGQDAPYQIRVTNYASAMKEVASVYRNDPEAQVFYALALLAVASPWDHTHSQQKQAAKILEPLFRTYPQHPGIAHYLIHAYDSGELAGRGVVAARAYSRIAPSAPHALHMPSHIFTRLGMWDESIVSNRAARIAAHQHGDTGEELHAMDYLVYAYLQEDRAPEAKAVLEELARMNNLDQGDFKIAYAAVAMPVRYAVELRRWADAASISPPPGAPPHVLAIAVWARALGLARSGLPAQVHTEIDRLHQLETQLRDSGNLYWARQVGIQALEASAWLAQAEGKRRDARVLLAQAAGQEDTMEKLPVTPGPIIPAREQLGELLLAQNEPTLAVREFQRALANAPRRRAALQGRARAAELAGARGSLP